MLFKLLETERGMERFVSAMRESWSTFSMKEGKRASWCSMWLSPGLSFTAFELEPFLPSHEPNRYLYHPDF
jgi:hypothetical protein